MLTASLGARIKAKIRETRAWAAWIPLSPTQRWLILANVGYLVLLFVFLLLWQVEPLKYALMVAGVILAAMLSELASKDQPYGRLALLCIPAIAIVLVQITTDRENDAKQMDLSRRIEARQLSDMRDQILYAEKRAQEELILDPYDTIDTVHRANRGFISKANMIALHGAVAQVQLVATVPALTGQVPSLSENLETRLSNYRTLKVALGDSHSARQRLDEITNAMEAEAAYRHAAKVFSDHIAGPLDEFVARHKDKDSRDFRKMREEVWHFFSDFKPILARANVAGVSNFLGSLARAAGRQELALFYFYQGYENDRRHLPIYESLAYSMWTANLDATTALKYATQGLNECESLRKRLEAEMKVIAQTVASDSQGTDFATLFPAWIERIDKTAKNLRLQYAYFSALVVRNEATALKYARELYDSDKDDGEYQDTLGFVLMRFGNPRELDEAEGLFKSAIERAKSERLTPRLAERHLKELQDLRDTLRGVRAH
jgi:hypothetical protein